MVQLHQKIADAFCSEQGARDFTILHSVIATARKQVRNVLETPAPAHPTRSN